jgi:hypothetical protein
MVYKYRDAEPERKDKVHPIWRGIGCLLLILIPLISFASSILLVDAGLPQQYIRMTGNLARLIDVPGFGLIPLLYVGIVTVVLSVLGFVLMTVLYSFVYMFTGRSKYGPLDSPPIKRKVKKSR